MLEGEIQVCRIPHRLLKGQKFRCSGDLETKNRIKHDLLGISCLTASRYDSLKKGEVFIVDKTGVVIICKLIIYPYPMTTNNMIKSTRVPLNFCKSVAWTRSNK